MKNVSITFLVFSTLMFFGIDVFAQIEGLIAHYSFDGNAEDESEFENDGVAFNVVLTEDRNGDSNSAFLFNGTNSYISIPTSESLESPTNEITMMAWVKLNGQSLVGDAFNPILMKSNLTSNSFSYRFSVGFNNVLGASINNWNNSVSSINSFIDMNNWHHIAVSMSSDSSRFYVDGQLMNTVPFAVDITPNSLPLEIGRDVPGLTEAFNGVMDDVKIFNKALSSEDISEIVNGVASGIKAENQHSLFDMHPNPSSGIVQIETSEISIANLELYNLQGKKVPTEYTINDGSITLSSASKGIHFIVINSDKGIIIEKIIFE